MGVSIYYKDAPMPTYSAATTYTMIDYDQELSTINLNVAPISGATSADVGTALAAHVTARDALETAILNVTNGLMSNVQSRIAIDRGSAVPPTDQTAQRERKWLVRAQDTTEELAVGVPNPGYRKLYSYEVPCADPEGRLVTNTNKASLTNTDIAAFVTAFEAFAKSPTGGTLNVLEILLVGRAI